MVLQLFIGFRRVLMLSRDVWMLSSSQTRVGLQLEHMYSAVFSTVA